MTRMALHIKQVILDRDGVLNRERTDGGYVCDWSQWHWLPGAIEGLAMLGAAGIRLSIATNQSCVGRGLISRADLDALHARVLDEAGRQGVVIADMLVCPHAPDRGCGCRKPAPGLLRKAIKASGARWNEVIAVGDDLRDLQAAQAANLRAVLVRTGKGRATEAAAARPIIAFDNLRAFAQALVSDSLPCESTPA
jgi:D-glycero-D-manno-heptose 1,7-bisphosphate phosphatase